MTALDVEEAEKRRSIDLALTAAKKRLSSQTGLIHLHYDGTVDPHTIPLLENFCFALALLRSRLSEQVLEGKALLERLLPFEVSGNFPIYLHEFPQCKDRSLSLHILPILHWILRDFSNVIGDGLVSSIQGLQERIFSHAERCHAEKALPKCAEIKWRASLDSFSWTPSTLKEWGDWMIAWHLACDRGAPVQDALHKATSLWNPHYALFIGSCKEREQEGLEPAVSLFDLFMAQLFNRHTPRLLKDHPLHLQAALITPFPPVPLATVPETPFLQIAHVGDLHPYALFWDKHSFVFEPKKGEVREIIFRDDGAEILFELPLEVPKEGDERYESRFFCSLHRDVKITVDGESSTTFQLGESICVASSGLRISLVIVKVSGEGEFFGHLLRGNRQTQVENQGENRFATYDWQLVIRTVKRDGPCLFSAVVTALAVR